jgi:UDP-GlcNAc:undecaprenyl-phosphate GlcNAc-1-phosphate transferase
MLQGYFPAFALTFAIGVVVAALLSPVARALGLRLGLVDQPGGRRQHRGAISRLGGIALYAGFTVALLGALLLPARWFPPSSDPNEMLRLTGVLVGTTFVFVFGLLDDRYEFASGPQYAVQFASALIAIIFIIFIERINNPFGADQIVFPRLVVWVLTIFWFMGMINTVNWLDGIDGLAAATAAIMSGILAIHMIREGQLSVALLPVALLGATAGFLPFNFSPARLFMGSSGSYFLGWALAALGIIAGAKVATVLLVMGLPILDVAWLMVNRWRRGGARGLGEGGRDHLHHRLLDMGFTPRQIVLGYSAFCLAFGAAALGLENRIYKVVALLVLAGLALAVLVWAGRGESEG